MGRGTGGFDEIRRDAAGHTLTARLYVGTMSPAYRVRQAADEGGLSGNDAVIAGFRRVADDALSNKQLIETLAEAGWQLDTDEIDKDSVYYRADKQFGSIEEALEAARACRAAGRTLDIIVGLDTDDEEIIDTFTV